MCLTLSLHGSQGRHQLGRQYSRTKHQSKRFQKSRVISSPQNTSGPQNHTHLAPHHHISQAYAVAVGGAGCNPDVAGPSAGFARENGWKKSGSFSSSSLTCETSATAFSGSRRARFRLQCPIHQPVRRWCRAGGTWANRRTPSGLHGRRCLGKVNIPSQAVVTRLSCKNIEKSGTISLRRPRGLSVHGLPVANLMLSQNVDHLPAEATLRCTWGALHEQHDRSAAS